MVPFILRTEDFKVISKRKLPDESSLLNSLNFSNNVLELKLL